MDEIYTIPYNVFVKPRNAETIFIGLLTVLALGTVLHLLQVVFIPLTIAGLLSLMLTPVVNRLKKWKIPRGVGILLVMLALFFVIYIVGRLFYTSLQAFIQVFGSYQLRFIQILEELWIRFKIPGEYFPQMVWTQELINRLVQVTGSFVSFGSTLGLILLFLVFMLAETTLSWRKFRRAFPRRLSLSVGRAVADVSRQVARYLRVKIFISSVTGVLVWLTLTLIGQDLAPLWGLLAFFLNFIPNLGSFFIMAATMILGLIQFYPEWNHIAAVWIVMPAIQITMGNIIDPQLQGDQLDLSPLVILVSLIFWGWIWGITGMFLAVPLTVAMKITLDHIDGLKPFSIMMGSGKMSRSFRRQWRGRRKHRDESGE
ncbi:MAG: AI-2E family transporter [Spirochaetes bacterium]|nr:MAG: AI-2E family transporter [Spirochaetota bacterium]